MKLIVLLMLSTLIVEGIAMHTCGRPVPESCRNNSRIRITKSDKHYRLNLCKNHPDCLHRSPEEWFDCNDVCEVCRSLPGQPGCANNMACEEQVDAYLNSYCKSALPSTVTAGPTVIVTTTHASITITETAIVTTVSTTSITTTSTKTVYSTCSPSGECNLSGTNSTALFAPPTASQKPTLVLGALLGLCIVALLIVTTGWIWTYSVMKRNARTDDNSQRLKFDVNKFFKNPTYEGADTPPQLSPSELQRSNTLTPEQMKFQKNKYDRIVMVPSQAGTKHKYDVLNRSHNGAETAACTGTPSSESPQEGNTAESQQSTGGQQYSQLGCRDKEVENYCVTRLVE